MGTGVGSVGAAGYGDTDGGITDDAIADDDGAVLFSSWASIVMVKHSSMCAVTSCSVAKRLWHTGHSTPPPPTTPLPSPVVVVAAECSVGLELASDASDDAADDDDGIENGMPINVEVVADTDGTDPKSNWSNCTKTKSAKKNSKKKLKWLCA